jgi:cysteinyl-tRNA synthetase
MVMAVSNLKARHAELVSASIVPNEPSAEADKWTLKQVQGDVDPGLKYQLEECEAAISDDLNTAKGLTHLDISLDSKAIHSVSPLEQLVTASEMDRVLGLRLLELTREELRVRPKAATITEAEIEAALAERREARAAKDFAKSDAIRDDLIAKGVEVMDGDPLGWDWRIEV